MISRGKLYRIGYFIAVFSISFSFFRAGHTETLTEALGRAYLGNPTLQAERARVRAVDEQVPQALAAARPTTNLITSTQRQSGYDYTANNAYRLDTRSVSLDMTQPLYKGGRIDAGIASAENKVQAARASLLSTEQTTLLSSATAYMDVIRDRASLNLLVDYQKVLRNVLDIEKRRLLVGENTKTDVSQAEARVAQAISDRIQAETTLRSSVSDFVRLIGSEPEKLEKPKVTLEVPRAIEDIIEAARSDNPDVVAARFTERSARHDVEAIDAELLPSVDAVGSLQRQWDPSLTQSKLDTASITLRMTVPIDNGSVAARARGARQTVSQSMQKIDEAQRTAADRAVKSWNGLMAIRAQIIAHEAGVKSIEETLKSLRSEVNIGVRSVTDLLNAEQEALSARQALLSARHDETILSFSLLSAIGRLSAQNLKLAVDYYDYEAHYRQIRDKIWGISLTDDPK